MYIPFLTILVFFPLLGALLLLLLPRLNVRTLYTLAGVWALLELIGAAFLIDLSDAASAGYNATESLNWVPSLGLNYRLGLDNISAWLVILTAFLTLVTVVGAGFIAPITDRPNVFLAWIFGLEMGIIGVFLSTNLLLFYVFWEVMIIPAYFLIGQWGGPNRVRAAVRFVLYTFAGSLLMLVSILALVFLTTPAGGIPSLDFESVRKAIMGLPAGTQDWLFLGFAAGFVVKVPLIPFQTWLPDAYQRVTRTRNGDVGRGNVQNWGLWLPALRSFFVPQRGPRFCTLVGGSGLNQYHLWGIGGSGPNRFTPFVGLFQPQPHGFYYSRDFCDELAGREWRGFANGQSRYRHARSVLGVGSAGPTCTLPKFERNWRSAKDYASSGRVVFGAWTGFARSARPKPVRGRISDIGWLLSGFPYLCSCGRRGIGAGGVVYDAFLPGGLARATEAVNKYSKYQSDGYASGRVRSFRAVSAANCAVGGRTNYRDRAIIKYGDCVVSSCYNTIMLPTLSLYPI